MSAAKEVSHSPRISNTTAALMIGTAFFIDLIQAMLAFFPILGWILARILSLVAWLGFFIWYKICNVGFFEGTTGKVIAKKIGLQIVTIFLELAAGEFPMLTINTVCIILVVRLEDEAIQKDIVSAKSLEQLEEILEGKSGKLRGAARIARTEFAERRRRRQEMVMQRNREVAERKDPSSYEERFEYQTNPYVGV